MLREEVDVKGYRLSYKDESHGGENHSVSLSPILHPGWTVAFSAHRWISNLSPLCSQNFPINTEPCWFMPLPCQHPQESPGNHMWPCWYVHLGQDSSSYSPTQQRDRESSARKLQCLHPTPAQPQSQGTPTFKDITMPNHIFADFADFALLVWPEDWMQILKWILESRPLNPVHCASSSPAEPRRETR